jgi:hypothetical protein
MNCPVAISGEAKIVSFYIIRPQQAVKGMYPRQVTWERAPAQAAAYTPLSKQLIGERQ